MGKQIVWDQVGTRTYETGVDRGVLYKLDDVGAYTKGFAWNGLIGVSEKPSGAEPTPLYADNIKYLNLLSVEEFKAGVEAYTYPDEFASCDGTAEIAKGVTVGQQARETFGMAYRTKVGNDQKGDNYAYKLHLIYGATAAPSEKGYKSINNSPEAITFNWELSTTPVSVSGLNPTASLTIDSRTVTPETLAEIEKILYGDETTDPRLPLPDEIATLVKSQG